VPLLVDGNNLAFRLVGRADRATVRKSVLDLVRRQRTSITIVFDGPPPKGSPTREALGRVMVLYSGGRTADDLIVQQIPKGRAACNFTVVTDDRGLARRVQDAGARVIPASDWISRLRRRASQPDKPPVESPLSPSTIAEWEAYFSRSPEEDDEA